MVIDIKHQLPIGQRHEEATIFVSAITTGNGAGIKKRARTRAVPCIIRLVPK